MAAPMTTKPWKIIGIAAVAGLLAMGSALIYFGAYDVAADAPHTKPALWLISKVRQRSIAVRAGNIEMPADLGSPTRVATGAGLYNEMCASCHLAPGMEKTEISQGLYPAAPELSHGSDLTPAEKFWVIKHGLKMTGMAAWGKTHDDTLIWDMVAFLQKMPKLSPEQYRVLVKSAPEDHNEMMKMKDMDHAQ
jgi:hypothetical protein